MSFTKFARTNGRKSLCLILDCPTDASYQVIPFLVVVLSTLKEAYRDEEDVAVEGEITGKTAEKKTVEGEAAKEEAAADDVEVEITKAPKEAWKKPTDKLYRFKIIGKLPEL